MKVIDSRSGEILRLGQTVTYGDGEKLRLVDVDEGLFSAQALIETTTRDLGEVDQPLVTSTQWVGLTVRFMHPAFLFQHVAFIQS